MRKRKGVLTLEAALVVPIFVFLIFFMTQLMKVVYIYDTVQANIYNTARFVNGYTYLAEATGLTGYSDDHNFDNLLQEVQGIFSSNEMPSRDTVDGLVNELLHTILSESARGGINMVVGNIAKNNLKDDFESRFGSGYVSNLGIVSGEFDFSNSEVTVGSDGKVKLVVDYSIRVAIPIVNVKKDLKLTNKVVISNFTGM